MVRLDSEYMNMLLSLKKYQFELSKGRSRNVPYSARLGYSIGYMEKKGNLLGSVIGLTVWVRQFPKHTTVEILGWWNEPAQVGQHWEQQMLENK